MFEGLMFTVAEKLYPVKLAETREEFEAIWRLRYEISVGELNRMSGSEIDHENRWFRFPEDEAGNAFVLYCGTPGKILATLRGQYYPPGTLSEETKALYSLDLFEGIDKRCIGEVAAFYMDRSSRGKIAAASIVCKIIETLSRSGAEMVFHSCVPGLLRTYKKMGSRPYGGRVAPSAQFGCGIVIPMLAAVDLPYLKKIKSPVYYTFASLIKEGVIEEKPAPYLDVINRARGKVVFDSRDVADELKRAVEDLPGLDLLERLSQGAREDIHKSGYIVDLEAGVEVIRDGVKDNELYIVLEGIFEARQGDRVLSMMDKGEIFGEVAFFRNSKIRSASVFALTNGRVLVLRRKLLDRFAKERPRDACLFYEAITHAMAERIAAH